MAYQVDRVGLTRAAVDALFSGRVDADIAPSSVYAVFDAGGIIFSGGFGSVDGRTPTVDTAYRIASCTKSFTAAALMIMVERRQLSLDDPLDRHLELGPLIGPDGRSVPAPTVRELVTMAGGLPTDDPWADRQESLSTEEFQRLITAGLRFTAAPGERFEYSNLGFALLGRVIEIVSGRTYTELVTEELINTLGLTGVGYDSLVAGVDGLAIGHRRLDGAWQRLPFSTPGAFSPIGGLFATPRALASWSSWLNAGWRTGDDQDQPLGRLSRQLMQTAQTPISSEERTVGYGLGLMVEEDGRHGRILSHSGGYPGFGAHVRWHAETGIGVVAYENATYSRPAMPAVAALQLILDETIRPEELPRLWPETLAARQAIEQLLRSWDDHRARSLFADNVDLDEPLERRRTTIDALVSDIDLGSDPVPLIDASPHSRSPAHLRWTVSGRRGSLRCEIQLTPQQPPKVQTFEVRRG
jgi:CubicO group peptidase (beta-lactamase class C family)